MVFGYHLPDPITTHPNPSMDKMTPEALPFSRLDTAFAQFLTARTALDETQKQGFHALVLAVSCQQNQGHNCISLNEQECALMLASGMAIPLTDPTAQPAAPLPLVLEHQRLYLYRYWFYEQRLAKHIKALCQQHQPPHPNSENLLTQYFGAPTTDIDWQRVAAKTALEHSFCMITGGPGTGKTTTVVKILAVLQELATQPLLIALAAPTGKAAMRLQEAIGFNKAKLSCPEALKASIPDTVTTLHRLLGAKPASPYFRHHAQQPLIYDLVVVDEASMVDLALMSKLLDALKPNCRLILLGDKDQLASVESGAVLADLSQALPQHTVELKTSHRFDGGIKQLADAVNGQDATTASQLLHSGDPQITWLADDMIAYIAAQQAAYLRLVRASADELVIFQVFNRFQVLCATKLGKNSVADINDHVEQSLMEQQLIKPTGLWYVGRPVMVTQNDAALHLYNGDIGICLAEEDGSLSVCFLRTDGTVKKYLPARLPHCETVYAMTIHKSQGSEFDEVVVVLPETMNPVLTKELLYTAITRAKKTVRLVADEAVFAQTVNQCIERVTGLQERLVTAHL